MNPSDNIGLTDFLVLVYKFFKRNFVTFSVFTLIGLLLGGFYSYQKKTYYSSELIGFSSVIDKTTLLEILIPLTTLVEEKNFEEVSNKLGLSIEDAAQIRIIEFLESKHTKTSHSPSTTDKKLGNLILIQTQVYNQDILTKLEAGIIFYLAQNKFISNTKGFEYQKTIHLIEDLTSNIALIDSINRSVQESNSSIAIMNEMNPNHYKEAIASLENLKIRAQTLEPFTVISSFYKLNKASNKSLLITIAITLTFFLLGLGVVFIKELAKLANK